MNYNFLIIVLLSIPFTTIPVIGADANSSRSKKLKVVNSSNEEVTQKTEDKKINTQSKDVKKSPIVEREKQKTKEQKSKAEGLENKEVTQKTEDKKINTLAKTNTAPASDLEISMKKKDIVEKYRMKDFKGVSEIYESDQNVLSQDEVVRTLVGISYRESNEDIKAFEALNFSAKNSQVQQKVALEKAVVCYKMGNTECVNEEVNKLDQDKLPDNVKKFIEAIKNNRSGGSQNNKLFYGSIGGGYLYDSNPTLSSLKSNIILYGFTLPNGDTNGTPDMGGMGNALLGYNHKFQNNTSIFGTANLSYTDYSHTQIRDTFSTSLTQGFAYRHNNHITVSLPVSYNNLAIGSQYIGNPANLFLQLYTVAPSFDYKTDNNITFKTTFSFSQKFFGNPGNQANGSSLAQQRNSFVYMGNQAVYTNITNYTIVYGSVGGGYEDAKTQEWTNYFLSGAVMIRQYLPIKAVLVYGEVSYGVNWLNYLGINPMLSTSTKRQDLYNSVKCSIHAIFMQRIDVSVSYIYERNIANTTLYDFQRQRVMANVNLMF